MRFVYVSSTHLISAYSFNVRLADSPVQVLRRATFVRAYFAFRLCQRCITSLRLLLRMFLPHVAAFLALLYKFNATVRCRSSSLVAFFPGMLFSRNCIVAWCVVHDILRGVSLLSFPSSSLYDTGSNADSLIPWIIFRLLFRCCHPEFRRSITLLSSV